MLAAPQTSTSALERPPISFDVFLQRFQAGEKAEADRAAVLAVLEEHEYSGPDRFGFYCVRFRDGTEAEFSAGSPETSEPFYGCAFHLRGISPELCAFVYAVARAGDMVILPAMEDFTPILVSSSQAAELPGSLSEEFPPPALCSSSEDLEVLLNKGHAGWVKYRNHVTGN